MMHEEGEDPMKDPKPSNTADYLGVGLAILTALLAVGVLAAHVYLASVGKADTTVTLLLNVLALTFSTVCTIWVGRWSAHRENKAFIRAALRTTHGLHEGLEAAERSAVDGVNRMRDRTRLESQAVAELWEEVLGRVLEQVRGQMRRAQETIANWREFLPEEVDKISRAEQQKASALNEMTAAANQARAILRELGESPDAPGTAALRARIEALEQERSRLSASSALAIPETGEARKLLAMGAFEEAIAAYSSHIGISPENHTLYVQRARARYLAGDAEGALADLAVAQEKCPTDPTVARLQQHVRAGTALPPPSLAPQQAAWKQAVERGNQALAQADGERALTHYRAAREAGLINVFAVQNEAMALLVLGSPREARELLQENIGTMSGPFVRAQCLALIAVANALESGDAPQDLAELRESLENLNFMGTPFQMTESEVMSIGV
jgi:tetratricopeptide (TPR) repeat protein